MSEKRYENIKDFEKKAILIEMAKRYKLVEIAPKEYKNYIDENTGDIKTGLSNFFAEVDAPCEFKWPYFKDCDTGEKKPLEFLAQLDMSLVSKYDESGLLPKTGYLYFFIDFNYPGGYEVGDNGYGKVLYYDVDKSDLTRKKNEYIEAGYEEDCLAISRVLKFSKIGDYPTEPQFVDEEIYMPNDVFEELDYRLNCGKNPNYLKWNSRRENETAKLLGYEEYLQYSEIKTCEEIYEKLYGETGGEWLVLLQYRNYFYYIKKEDLINRRFDRVWVMNPCFD